MMEPPATEKKIISMQLPLRELTEQTLLKEISQSAVLVNEKGDILYLHGKAGKYLEFPSGEVSTNNILKMARPGLLRVLTVALHKAHETKETIKSSVLRVKVDDHFVKLGLTISHVDSDRYLVQSSPVYLVIFEEYPQADQDESDTAMLFSSDARDNERIETLTNELHTQEEFLQTTNEKLALSNRELISYNEEMQSMNEELQSTNEELETSKEELQSMNEELSTVNTELQEKVTELARSNNDMNNLLAGTGIGTVFVDNKLCILRFTPAVTKIINLILSDLGRPVGHIVSNLVGYDSLKEDVQEVLDTLIPKEIEVQSSDGKWYVMRIQPYRTLDNVIEGAVITFVEISEIVNMKEKLRETNKQLLHLAVIVRDANDAITVQDLNGNILAWNPKAVELYGWSETEALKMNMSEMIPEEEREEALSIVHKLSQSEVLEPYNMQRLCKDGSILKVSVTSTALRDEEGEFYAISTTERETK
jgi:two-component system CheB/CheR fusion protein